jgi:polysaccharide pyruvyl transferase WcaK-like protein
LKRIAYLTEFLYSLLLAPLGHIARILGFAPRRVTIIGWWGSETVGDIAILGQLLAELEPLCATKDLRIVSFDAALTRRSLLQLGKPDVSVVPLGVQSAVELITSRTVIVGGGPLMESPAMRFWAWNARVARFTGAQLMLYANGIGPLRSKSVADAVRVVVRKANYSVLRDTLALAWAKDDARRMDAQLSFDPAYDYLRSKSTAGTARKPQLALALRTPPASYLGSGDVASATEGFVRTLAAALDAIAEAGDVSFVGIVMHTGHADSDDHAVYRQLRSAMRHPERLQVAPGEHSISQVIATLQESRAALTVRFHAMIFALATRTPFVAVDYARPDGKVSAAASDIGRSDDVILWDALTVDALTTKLLSALDAGDTTAPDLRAKTDTRLAVLRAAVGA